MRPTHIALDLTLDFDAKRIHGTAELDLVYAKGRRPTFLALDSRGLEVARITDPDTGGRLAFTLEPPVPFLGQRLRITLPERRPKRVRIEYRTGPQASALQWLEPAQTTSGQRPFLFTQAQAINARSFVPCIDSPGVRITYDAVIHVPPGMVAVMGARARRGRSRQGSLPVPHARVDPALPDRTGRGGDRVPARGSSDGRLRGARPSWTARHPSSPTWRRCCRWPSPSAAGTPGDAGTSIVLPPSFPFGGMENPRLTFATPTILAGDRSLVNVVVHELAHSWSGNLVTSADLE